MSGQASSSTGSIEKRWENRLLGPVVLFVLSLAIFLDGAARAASVCPNEGIRTVQGAKHLPDCRAWERVSPVAKGNSDVNGGAGKEAWMQASLDGNGIVYTSNGAFPGIVRGGGVPFTYLAHRGLDGWWNESLTPPSRSTLMSDGETPVGYAGQVLDVTEDLGQAAIATDVELVPGAGDGTNIFTQDNLGSGFELVTLGSPSLAEVAPNPSYYATFQDATPDLRRTFFTNSYPMAPGAFDQSGVTAGNLYEYSDGAVSLVSIDSSGAPIVGHSIQVGAEGAGRHNPRRNAISRDGSRVFFDAKEYPGGDLHVRINGAETVQIPDSDEFYEANPSGSRVLYLQGGPGVSQAVKLFDVESETSTDVLSTAECASKCIAIAASDDLSRVYYANFTGTEQYELYLWEDGVPHLIATIESRPQDFANELLLDKDRVLSASADGSKLAFVAGEVNGVDSNGAYLVYLYDATTDQLDCVSCPQGELPSAEGEAALWGSADPFPPGAFQHQLHRPRNISADGDRVFFQTAESLVLADSNGVEDVYVWEDGGPQLLSSGRSQFPARFLDADAIGDNAFFVTRAQLVASDRDEYDDVYVARAGGGFAEQGPPPPPCEGDACQGPALPLPERVEPATVSALGVPRRCARFRGKAKRSEQRSRPGKKKRSRGRAAACRRGVR